MSAQIRSKYSAETAILSLDKATKLLDKNSTFDYIQYAQLFTILNWTGTIEGLFNFQTWLSRIRQAIKLYFVTAEFTFTLVLREQIGV
jgi:hypothetical protein